MAWVKIDETALYTWDGSDSDFPAIKFERGMPTYGYPLINEAHGSYQRETTPLLGMSTNVCYSPFDELASWLGLERRYRRGLIRDGWNRFTFPQRFVSETENRSRVWISKGTKNQWYTRDHDKGVGIPEDYREHNTVMRYHAASWSVTVRKSIDHAGVRLPTDSVGVREMLKDREKNGTRRSPMLHWVTEHTRKSRNDDEATHDVRAYLRGSRKCNWRGYLVEIRESELEREKEIERKGTV